MNTSTVQSKMDECQLAVEAALTKWGFESLWANGKGGGFWVKGRGYMSLEDCARLINQSIADFIKSEKERLNDQMSKAMAEAQAAQNSSYFEKAMTVYSKSDEALKSLATLAFPNFYLPALPPQPFNQNTFRPLPNPVPEPKRLESDELVDMRNRLKSLHRLAAEAVDKQDWDLKLHYEQVANEVEDEIKAIVKSENLPNQNGQE